MRVIIFGAGAVGCGLLGKIFATANHDVCFVDTQANAVAAIARTSHYWLNYGTSLERIGPVTAMLSGTNIYGEVRRADAIFTSVRVENVCDVARLIRDALSDKQHVPCDIIAVENTPHPNVTMQQEMSGGESGGVQDVNWWHGIAECVIPEPDTGIGRGTPELSNADSNGYLVLPKQLKAKFGTVDKVVLSDDFEFDWVLKWYCHCALHAVVAYVGIHRGFTLIENIIREPHFRNAVCALTQEAAEALSRIYGRREHIAKRFSREIDALSAPPISDTCQRVARDAARKVLPGERLRDLECLVGGNALVAEAIVEAKRIVEEITVECIADSRIHAVAGRARLLPSRLGRGFHRRSCPSPPVNEK
jgi:hypothetical protein